MLLVDAYHHLNVVPFDINSSGLQEAFVTGGGYKYCQLGEGNCFLRVPPDCSMRPVLTGWFAEFDGLEEAHSGRVHYGAGAAAFAGATYDPTSHYRAAAVFAFHQEQGLTDRELRRINRQQVSLLKSAFEALNVDPGGHESNRCATNTVPGFWRFERRGRATWPPRCASAASWPMHAATSCVWAPPPICGTISFGTPSRYWVNLSS